MNKQIKKAIRIKEGNSVMGLTEDGKVVKACVYRNKAEIQVGQYPYFAFDLYEEDTENYEPMTIHSFKRMVRLANHRIQSELN